ncbi:hypothetical protein BGW42_006590 [Actinomortierella wolfii]|nr:hypothetical protein BGW42_006590 [Actinomortierella wolfii]
MAHYKENTFIIFAKNLEEEYKECARSWLATGVVELVTDIPEAQHCEYAEEKSIMGAYGVYEGNGIMKFVDVETREMFKCTANTAIIPLANLIAVNVPFGDYVADYEGYSEHTSGEDLEPLDFSKSMDAIREMLQQSDSF